MLTEEDQSAIQRIVDARIASHERSAAIVSGAGLMFALMVVVVLEVWLHAH